MGTDLWMVDRTGDHLATDDSVPCEQTRESMIDASADLSLVEIEELLGEIRRISSQKFGWTLLTSSPSPADAILSAALSDWTEIDHGTGGAVH